MKSISSSIDLLSISTQSTKNPAFSISKALKELPAIWFARNIFLVLFATVFVGTLPAPQPDDLYAQSRGHTATPHTE